MSSDDSSVQGVRDWVEFFRDIGIDSLYTGRRAASEAPVAADLKAPRPRLAFVWDPPLDAAARSEAEDLLRRLFAKLDRRIEDVPGIVAPAAVDKDREAETRQQLDARIRETGATVVVAFGAAVSRLLSGSEEGIVELRGRAVDCNGYVLIPTYHPTYLLKRSSRQSETWADLRSAAQRANSADSNSPRSE